MGKKTLLQRIKSKEIGNYGVHLRYVARQYGVYVSAVLGELIEAKESLSSETSGGAFYMAHKKLAAYSGVPYNTLRQNSKGNPIAKLEELGLLKRTQPAYDQYQKTKVVYYVLFDDLIIKFLKTLKKEWESDYEVGKVVAAVNRNNAMVDALGPELSDLLNLSSLTHTSSQVDTGVKSNDTHVKRNDTAVKSFDTELPFTIHNNNTTNIHKKNTQVKNTTHSLTKAPLEADLRNPETDTKAIAKSISGSYMTSANIEKLSSIIFSIQSGEDRNEEFFTVTSKLTNFPAAFELSKKDVVMLNDMAGYKLDSDVIAKKVLKNCANIIAGHKPKTFRNVLLGLKEMQVNLENI